MRKKLIKKFQPNNSAVSAIAGVILMVAITIAIAATTYVYVSGVESKPSNQLNIQLNPPGYPELYSEWQISVWKIVNGTYYVGENVTIIIEIFDEESTNNNSIYYISTDDDGLCQFHYRDPLKHKFTAIAEGFISDYYEPAKEYIGPENIAHITNLFGPFGLIAIISIIITLIKFEKESWNQPKLNFKKLKNILSIIRYLLFTLIFLIFLIGICLVTNLYDSHVSVGYPVNENLFYLNIFFWVFIGLFCTYILTFLIYEGKNYFLKEKGE